MPMNDNRSWFRFEAKDKKRAEVIIYDEIGMWGITAKDFHQQLKALGADVTHLDISINSPGGEVFAGLSIYNMLARHKAQKTVTIDGIAASMASVIAMAGDTIIMPENAMMMIHDPSGVVIGTSKDMRELANALDKMKSSMIAAYAGKSGKDREEIAEIMATETWLTAEEAVEMGFADEIEEPVKAAAKFDLSKFKNTPADVGREMRGRAAPNSVPQESSMTEQEKAAAAEAEQKRLADEATAKAVAEVKAKIDAEAAEAAKKAGTETPEQIAARVAAEVTKRNADIAAACAIAGKADKAVAFIAEGKSLSEVLAALKPAATEQTGDELNARNLAAKDVVASWDKQVEKMNARVPSAK
jgi:ATP-dependent Clp endopeptidase proteolytic subunit ClpP